MIELYFVFAGNDEEMHLREPLTHEEEFRLRNLSRDVEMSTGIFYDLQRLRV